MKRYIIVIAAITGLLVSAARAEDDPFAWRWYQVGDDQQVEVNLFLFFRSTCPHCRDAVKFVDELKDGHPWLVVKKYDIGRHSANLELYRRMAASMKRSAGTVPAFFYCKQLTLGFHGYRDTGSRVEASLVKCRDALQQQLDARTTSTTGMSSPAVPPLRLASFVVEGEVGHHAISNAESVEPNPDLEIPDLEEPGDETVEVPLVGEVAVDSLSLPIFTAIIAGCDAFNPCAFFILLSLLSLLIHARSRGRMLLVGGIFVAFSGLFYFLFMAAWLNVFLLAGNLKLITIGAGLLAIVVAIVNIKDFFALNHGFTLSIPESAKPGLFDQMRRLVAATALCPMLLGTLGLAIAANTYELLCTAGFPMVFTRVLTLRDLPASSYYAYLVLYNLIYMVPLAAIVLAFTFTLGARKLQEREGRILKLLSGVMMFELGLVILLAPQWLQYVVIAVALLATSIGVTALIVVVDRLKGELPSAKRPAA